jgi:diaminohydroxyphosphoribosylaminopyrimidine deaminase/5-amino-6-(5-phosphoribosylamino)uracil reductase
MRHALALARRGLGRVAPNPAVGCVIVSEGGRIVGRGSTKPGGRPHAETVALEQAKERARGATVYVTLEPCAHQGKTPPCADALIRAGVKRVVAAAQDPEPRVNGQGFARLKAAGIELTQGVLEKEALQLNEGFLRRVRDGRPLVTLKVAQSLDGKIALKSGESRWITGEEARAFGHLMRAEHDAILVGIGTALADDPELTVRLAGLEDRLPLRIVLDTNGRLPAQSKLARTARKVPTLVFTAGAPRPELEALGVDVVFAARDAQAHIGIPAMLAALAKRGVTRLLVEGGAAVHASFLSGGLVDRLEVFTAPIVLGGDALDSVAARALADIKEASRFERTGERRLDGDLLESFIRKA